MSPFSPFRHTLFRRIWLANTVSNFGSLVQAVGASWTMATITPAADMVTLVQASTALPIMLFAIVSGALADNFDKRRIMLTAQVFMLALSILLCLFTYLGLITPWLLLSFTFIIGCGAALNNPSWQTSVGEIVPREDLPAAVSLNGMGFNLVRSVGPALGGIVVAIAGGAAAFAINVFTYIPMLAVLWTWRPVPRASTLPREPVAGAVVSGLRYVAMSPSIKRVLLRSFWFGISSSSVLALLPLVVRDGLHGNAAGYGATLAAFGVGAVAGALIGSRARETIAGETMIRICFLGLALCTAGLALSKDTWFALPALMIGGGCFVTSMSLFNVTVQLSTPRWVVGRAISIYQATTFAGTALGSWYWGHAAAELGLTDALLVSCALLSIGAIIGIVLPLPTPAALDLDPLGSFIEPPLAIDITPKSGPILIQIDFEIASENVAEFLQLMEARRRIRMRDGARDWALGRDLCDARRWTESFRLPTWTDYVRHNHRRTKADAQTGNRLRALHRGDGPPPVRRHIERPPRGHAEQAPQIHADPMSS
jgi:MFS family permease